MAMMTVQTLPAFSQSHALHVSEIPYYSIHMVLVFFLSHTLFFIPHTIVLLLHHKLTIVGAQRLCTVPPLSGDHS